MSASKRIRSDIQDRLERTKAFDVVRGRLPEDVGFSGGAGRAACVEPAAGHQKPQWDGGEDTGIRVDDTVAVTLIARDNNPEVCDDVAGELLEHLKDAVDGQSLAEITVADLTYVASWSYLKPTSPERRVRCVVQYTLIREGWGGAEESD